MKKILFFLVGFSLMTALFFACAKPAGPEATVEPPANGDQTAPPAAISPKADIPQKADISPKGEGSVDVDLTALSSVMVYAEVNNMITEPGKYLGKRVKMSGKYYALYYEETEKYYHYVVISDATACCQQGLEFIWEGDHDYPDDYPADDTEVEITGVYDSYEELGVTYNYIRTDAITLLN